MIKDSVKFKNEALRCELASTIAAFLEENVAADSYDFTLPDLIYFKNEQVLLKLRQNANWLALESQFQAKNGLVLEDWEE